MPNVRPTASPLHLRRQRLLERLPDAPGFVVWLEAPYGYGKSVLAAQWADELEGEGWRVEWLSLAGQQARGALAEHLGLPAAAPWAVVRDEVWRTPALLVLEDLTGEEDLGSLLHRPGGLVLLASRQPLPYAELPKLETAGLLHHVTSDELAFDEREAASVFQDPVRGQEAWRLTQGWPLPLHFAALTGDLPQRASLLDGVRRSISEGAWHELLFVAAMDVLPEAAAVAATSELVRSGFLQRLAGGYRLHPLMSEAVIAAHRAAVQAELAAHGHRLEPTLRGAAFERADYREGLLELLASSDPAAVQLAPEAFLRWHELAPPGGQPGRLANVAVARFHLTEFDAAIPEALELVTGTTLSLDARARLAGVALATLGYAKRFAQAEPFRQAAEGLVPGLPPTTAAPLLRNLGVLAAARGDYVAAEARFKESLAALSGAPPDPALRIPEIRTRANLLVPIWELRGDLAAFLEGHQELVSRPDLDDATYVTLHQNLAVSNAYAGDVEGAKAALRKAIAKANAYTAILLRAILAFLDGDLAAFPGLLDAARKWETHELSERISALWLRALRRAGDLDSAFELLPKLESGPFTKLELVWAHAHRGAHAEASALLEETRGAYPYREYRVHWHAAAYIVDPSDERLDDLLSLTTSGARMLVYAGVPVAALPADRPELARAYPLDEVLASGSPAAVLLRLDEVPPLELRLLGGVSVRWRGEDRPLTDRQRELITLLALGVDRERIGEEMWPEVDLKRQRNSLGVHLNMLRKVLEPWGVPTFLHEGGLQRFTSDLHELEEALSRNEHEQVLALYAGPLARGVALPLVEEERASLRERVLQALFEGAGAGELLPGAEGSVNVAPGSPPARAELRVRLLRRLLELDPLHEEGLQALLALLVALGRRREAQRRLRSFEATLAAETGLTPQEATLALLSR